MNRNIRPDKEALVDKLLEENERLKVKNERLRKALQEASTDFYYIHQHSEDAHIDSYTFMRKVEQALKDTEKIKCPGKSV